MSGKRAYGLVLGAANLKPGVRRLPPTNMKSSHGLTAAALDPGPTIRALDPGQLEPGRGGHGAVAPDRQGAPVRQPPAPVPATLRTTSRTPSVLILTVTAKPRTVLGKGAGPSTINPPPIDDGPSPCPPFP